MNILFTCAGRRHYLLEYFKQAMNGEGRILGADMQKSAPALVVADKSFIVPEIYDSKYIDVILTICAEERVDALISLNDLELPVLASARKRFEKIGVKLIVSSDEVIDICFDKWKTFEFANKNGFKTPKTFVSLDIAQKALETGEIKFPLVVKPRWGSASIGIDFPDNEEELELAFRLQTLRIEKTILSIASSKDLDNAIIIQEKILGKEFGVDVLNDFSQKPQQVYVKEKLAMRSGETDKSVLREDDDLEQLGRILGERLGHIGNLDCDFFEKDGEYYLLEMNPRFGGGYPFSHQSGANYPDAILKWVKGDEYDFKNFSKNYDLLISKCDTLIFVDY